MAISVVGSAGASGINAASVTVTLPGSMAVDDLIIAAYGVGDDDFTQPTLAITTAGYTEIATSGTLSADGGTAGDGNLAVFYKFHNGTDTNVVTTAAGTGTDSSTACRVMVFRGVATVAQGGPTETTATASGTSGGDPNPPSVSGFDEATAAIVIVGAVGSSTAVALSTPPTNYTGLSVQTGDDSFDVGIGIAYRLSGAADPEDPGIMVDSGAGAAWCAATLVLKAAPAATPSLLQKRRDGLYMPLRDRDPWNVRGWK
jgi:hypothetical protein